MPHEYRPGETVVWDHVDEESGQRIKEFVVIMSVKHFTGRPYYQVKSLRTGEPASAWHDELAEFEVV